MELTTHTLTAQQYADILIRKFRSKRMALLCVNELIEVSKLYDIEILFSYQPFLQQTKQFITDKL